MLHQTRTFQYMVMKTMHLLTNQLNQQQQNQGCVDFAFTN